MIRMYPPDKEGRLLAAFRFHARYFSLAAETIHDHQAAFAALRDPARDNFALFPFLSMAKRFACSRESYNGGNASIKN
jgi:hypothetical protein